jgi:PAS domain S-box-containing protein
MEIATDHYLKAELYELVRTEPGIFEFLQNGSLDGIWYWDIEHPEEEWLSPRFKQIFGYRDDEIPNTSAWWQENIFPEDLELALDNFAKHCEDPSHPYDQVVRYRHKDGSTVWVRCRGLAIRNVDGRPVRMLGAHTEVTELKLSEARLQAALDEVVRVNRSLGSFAYSVAHDLKTPLRNIGTYAMMLRKTAGITLPEEAEGHFSRLKDAIRQVGSMVDGLLDFSTATDCSESSIEECDVVALVRSCADLLDPPAGLRVECPGSGPRIRTVAAAFQQVVLNLLSNAIKYHDRPEGRVRVTLEEAGEFLKVEVEDDGPGIPHEHQASLFEPFHRGDPRKLVEGHGLGLAIVKRVVESAGGALAVRSEPGQGSTFGFTWPLIWKT